jgi:acyl-CoA reductase-like NAD-dependent aldehyde dehydrogenase
MNDFRLLINGKLVEGAGTLDVINPATGRPLTTAPRADRGQLDQAVAAAKTAFPTWSATPLRQRAALLVKLAEALEAGQASFARLLTQEQGKPLPQALEKVARSARSATSSPSTWRPRSSRRTTGGRWCDCTSHSGSSRPLRRGTCRCSC